MELMMIYIFWNKEKGRLVFPNYLPEAKIKFKILKEQQGVLFISVGYFVPDF